MPTTVELRAALIVISVDVTGALHASARVGNPVDADLPTGNGSDTLAYAKLGAQDSMWVAIMEKGTFGGYDVEPVFRDFEVLTTDDLVSGSDVFFAATGITDGDLIQGVRYAGDSARTQSIVMRSRSGTIRIIDGIHRRKKLAQFSNLY